MDDFDATLRRYASTRDPELRNELVTAQLGLVNQLARRFASRGEPLDDLVQVASIGLIKAIEGYDPGLGHEFAHYATTTILGEIKRHFRDKGWSVKAPRRVQEHYLLLRGALDDLAQRLGRSPTVDELAHEVSLPVDEVLEALEAGFAYRSDSLDRLGTEGRAIAQLASQDDRLSSVPERETFRRLLDRLPGRERQIMVLRFVDDLNQAEIADRLGISQVHVSRLIARSVATLHAVVVEED